MKICPTCTSSTFDDMPVCYGCLHLFDDAAKTPAFYHKSDFSEDFYVEEPHEDYDNSSAFLNHRA